MRVMRGGNRKRFDELKRNFRMKGRKSKNPGFSLRFSQTKSKKFLFFVFVLGPLLRYKS